MLLICSVLLVLLAPSSAWSGDTGSPEPSPSSSPSDGSSSPASPEPTTTEDTTTPEPTPEPTATETVTVTPEPTPTEPTCTRDAPCVMEPTRDWVTLQLLLGGLSVMALLGLLVRSFAPRG